MGGGPARWGKLAAFVACKVLERLELILSRILAKRQGHDRGEHSAARRWRAEADEPTLYNINPRARS
jgi:hypothetical protein